MEIAQILTENIKLCPHIPTVKSLSKEHLSEMTKIHPIVYIKPENARHSLGIIRIERAEGNNFTILSTDVGERSKKSFKDLWPFIQQTIRSRSYVIQQGIKVSLYNKLSEIKVYLIRKDNKWYTLGSIACNNNPKPKAMPIKNYLADLKVSTKVIEKKISHIESLALEAVKTISNKHNFWWEYTVTITIDSLQKLWISDVNIAPKLADFKHGDIKLYSKIKIARKKVQDIN